MGIRRAGASHLALRSAYVKFRGIIERKDQCIVLDKAFLQHSRQNSKDGAVLFVFTDWRHLYGLMTASRDVGLSLKDLVVWAKASAAMGSFYRSGHELVLVLQNGEAVTPDIVKRGRRRRSRTNLWGYPALTNFPAGSSEDVARHSPAKPTALVADAIRDVTRRGDIILDPFAGNGTTIIAAEKNRTAYPSTIRSIATSSSGDGSNTPATPRGLQGRT